MATGNPGLDAARSSDDADQADPSVAATELERLRERLAAAEEELEVFSRLTAGYWWAADDDQADPEADSGAAAAGEPATVRAWVTPGFTAATGGDQALVRGLVRGAAVHPEDLARYREVLDEVRRGPGASGRERAVHEFRLFGADASILWVRQRLEGRRGSRSSARRLYASGELITERKRAEDALGHVEARFVSLVEHAPNVIITIDLAGTILFINRPVPGDEREPWELIGQSAFGLADVEHRDELRAAVAQIVAGKQAHEFSLPGAATRASADERRWYEVQAAPVIRAGEVVAITMILTDVSERRRATQALRRSESRWRFLWENVPDLIAELDVDGRVVHSNRELDGHMPSPGGGMAADCPLRQALELAARTGAPSSFELADTDPSGRERWYVNRVVPLGEASGRGFLWIVSDISDRKASERERADLEAQLRQQQKLESIGTLAGGVAHEINNPIQSIMNYADLVRLRVEPGGPVDEFASEIIHETERVAEIVRSLLAFARQEKQHHSPAQLLDILGSTRTLMAAVLRRDHIALDIDVPAELPPIRCRSQQIQQVFMNLLGNARDALNARYPEFDEDKRIRVVARAFERDGETWVATTVEDHGVGISPQVIDRVFDPFFTTKGPHAGTGLGLSVSHGIVREHRGELEVESEPGVFTRFRLNLRADNGWNLDLD
jgi:PAS domain S-box-containing protein